MADAWDLKSCDPWVVRVRLPPPTFIAAVAELADAQDLGSCDFGREGSTPSSSINCNCASAHAHKRRGV